MPGLTASGPAAGVSAASVENANAPAVYIQELCLRHKNIDKERRSQWERPERLRAVQYGVGAILARVEQMQQLRSPRTTTATVTSPTANIPGNPVRIIRSTAIDHDMSKNEAAEILLHMKDEEDTKDGGEGQGMSYAQRLQQWCKDSRRKIAAGLRELPEEFEADLYCESFSIVPCTHA